MGISICEEGNSSLESHIEINPLTSSNGTHHDCDDHQDQDQDQDQDQPIEDKTPAIVEKLESLEFKDEKEEYVITHKYPLRDNAVSCAFYLKTGTCKFGFNCRFNHPPNRVFKVVGENEKVAEEKNGLVSDTEKNECKYFSTPGGCKFGDACKYDHSTEKVETEGQELNFLGLPIRPLEKECTFYMRNGTCGYGANCRYHHPDPTAAKEFDGSSQNGYPLTGDNNSPKTHEILHSPEVSQGTLPEQSNGTNSRSTNSYHQRMPQISERNPNQGQATMSLNKPSLPHQIAKTTDPAAHYERLIQIEEFPERPGQPDCDYFLKTGDCKYRSACRYNHPLSRGQKLRLPPLSAKGRNLRSAKVLPIDSTDIPNSKYNNTRENGEPFPHHHQQMQNGNFPERPGQPECEYFMNNGDCKFRSACRYHHPRNRMSTSSPCALNEKGLPLRPGGKICRNYQQQGTCKYGRKCQFHHPDDDNSTAAPAVALEDHGSADVAVAAADSEISTSNNAESEWGDSWVIYKMDQIPDIGDEENNSKNIEEIFQDGQNTESEVSVEEPKIGMEFNSVDELYEYYKRYGKQLGFGISKRTSSKKGAEEARYITIVCNKAGSPRQTSKNMLRPRPTSVTNCRARINASVGRDGGWKITSVELAHNHVLSPSKARFHACHRVVNTHAKRRLELNDAAGIRLNKSFSSFVIGAGGYENISFLEKDARNHIQKMRQLMLQEGDAEAMHKYFVKMQATNQNFFYTMDLDKDGRLRNVFWADARSRAAYEEFGDVVTFDTTYLVDKYDMPFAPFVGVNHHGHSILFGCGLISAENTETFIWLFESWLTCMNGHAPQGIITDQDMAMRKAIEHVFPHTQHRRCLWHIMKKIPEKLSGYKEYKTIKFTLKAAVYNSLTPQEFEERWGTMIGKFNLHENEWLDSLFAIRHDWVPSYVKDRFWAGMSTTQRSESINAFFDGYVNSKTTLKQFVDQYENALRSKVEKENKADFDSSNKVIPCISHFNIEKQFQMVYTTPKFQEFQEELKAGKLYCELSLLSEEGMLMEYVVTEDIMIEERRKELLFTVLLDKEENNVKCNCNLFEFKGIICRHAIAVLLNNKTDYVPYKYILDRWRKDVKRRHTKVKVSYVDWANNSEMLWIDQMHESFNEVVNLVGDSKIRFQKVMDGIQKLKICIKNEDDNEKDHFRENNDLSNPSSKVSKEKSQLLDPVVKKRKGHPREKRLQSITDQVIEKKKRRSIKSNEKQIEPSQDKEKESMLMEHSNIDNVMNFSFPASSQGLSSSNSQETYPTPFFNNIQSSLMPQQWNVRSSNFDGSTLNIPITLSQPPQFAWFPPTQSPNTNNVLKSLFRS